MRLRSRAEAAAAAVARPRGARRRQPRPSASRASPAVAGGLRLWNAPFKKQKGRAFQDGTH